MNGTMPLRSALFFSPFFLSVLFSIFGGGRVASAAASSGPRLHGHSQQGRVHAEPDPSQNDPSVMRGNDGNGHSHQVRKQPSDQTVMVEEDASVKHVDNPAESEGLLEAAEHANEGSASARQADGGNKGAFNPYCIYCNGSAERPQIAAFSRRLTAAARPS